MKCRTKTNKASLQGMATGRALLQVFAVSLITSGFVLSANANERKTAIITFDAPGAGTGGPFQGTLVAGITPAGVITGGFFDANELEHTYLRFPGFGRQKTATFAHKVCNSELECMCIKQRRFLRNLENHQN